MGKRMLATSPSSLWSIMDKTNHELLLIRQREMRPHNIASQQLNVLRAIKDLGAQATVPTISEKIEGHICAVSRQVVVLEKDGLVKRIQDTPKSRLLRIVLTKKGLEMIKIPNESSTIDSIFSILNEEERHQMYLALNKVFSRSKEFNI